MSLTARPRFPTTKRGRWHSPAVVGVSYRAVRSLQLPCILCYLIDGGASSLLAHLQITSGRTSSRRLARPERIAILTYDANTEFSDASTSASQAFYMDETFPRTHSRCRARAESLALKAQAAWDRTWLVWGRWRHHLLRRAVHSGPSRGGERHSVRFVLSERLTCLRRGLGPGLVPCL